MRATGGKGYGQSVQAGSRRAAVEIKLPESLTDMWPGVHMALISKRLDRAKTHAPARLDQLAVLFRKLIARLRRLLANAWRAPCQLPRYVVGDGRRPCGARRGQFPN